LQAGATDSLARALRQVFTRPEYRWTEQRHPLPVRPLHDRQRGPAVAELRVEVVLDD